MTTFTFEWNKETWEASISAQCWWFTPYDAGWDECKKYGGDIAADDELKQIVDELTCESVNAFLKDNPPADFTVVTLGQNKLELPVGIS